MAEENVIIEPAPAGGPEVQEVDSITDAYDSNDVIIDDDGNVVQAFDREKNITYVVKGKGLVTPEKKDGEPSGSDPDKPDAGKPDGSTDPQKSDKKDDADDDGAEDYVNAAEYVLKKTGYTKDEVELADGQVVKIADLTEQQQLDIMVAEFENTTASFQEKIAELEGRQPELKFEDPMAQQLVDYLKQGGDIKRLAKEILSKDPAAQAKMLSDEEVIKMSLKKEFPSFTDEDINEEFNEMSDSKRARRAKALRERMENEKPDFSNLTEEQKRINEQAALEAKKVFEEEVNIVKSAAAELKEIAGIPMNDQVVNYLLKKAIPDAVDQDSEFVKSLSNNPKKLLTLQFWDTYGEKVLDATRKKYYEMGLEEGNKGKEKLSDEPVRTYNVGNKPEKKVVKKSVDEFSDKDWNAFINGESF
jgi:hypothetical protein